MALGSSAKSAAGIIGGDAAGDASLDFVSFDLSKPGSDMDVLASIRTERRFSSISWGCLGVDTGVYPYGVLAGGLQEGVISLWNPHAIVNSRGADTGLIHTSQVHKGTVNCVEFHPMRPELMATCGADSQVNIINLQNATQPALYQPSDSNKHAGSEVLCCAWNRKVQHILCSCSNTGTTVVWDLKQKKEVISFQDPANRQRISGVEWHPEVPTQLLVAYDDDRQPAIQMWDLRNCTYPFKETAGHSKGILGVAWNTQDPNLIMSSGKDNRLICWSNSEGKMETFCEMTSQQGNFEVKWAPHKPSLISAASFSGSVSVHSVQQQQNTGTKYCPRWYKKPCGVSFGFGGKMMTFGVKKAAAALATDTTKTPIASYCHSLVVPNEPEVVPSADMFESWIAEQKLCDYCHEKTRRSSNPHENLMWELMGTQFEDSGRSRVPILLGFDKDRIVQEAERFLGKQPGTTLMGPPPEEKERQQQSVAQPSPSLGPELDLTQAESFFDQLTSTTEQKKQEEQEREQKKLMEQALGTTTTGSSPGAQTATDWSAGPEAIIKQSILVGNLPVAVECCFQSGRMAEALLLASGGGTDLWTRARDEFLRLQADSFLSTVGNIMMNDFQKLVGSSNLANWKETLAIIATYSGDQYQTLCEQLAERLEKEKFDPRSALICHICARNFPKTVSIWAQGGFSAQGSQKLALQDLVEKMTVLQEATKFNQPDPLFNSKVTQYAEILANSGRLTAAMRYLCLLQHDASSAILRDRIYNSAPMQMSKMFGARPSFPFETTDVRIMYQPPAQQQQFSVAGAPGHPGMPKAPGMAPTPGMPSPGAMPPSAPGVMPPRPSHGGAMPPAPAGPGGYPGMGPGAPMPNPGASMVPGAPGPAPAPPGPGMGPAPRLPGGSMPGPGMGPAPSLPPAPMPGMPGPGMGPAPGMPGPGMGPTPSMPGPGMGPAPHLPGVGVHGPPGGHMAAPTPGPGVLPPGQASMASPSAAMAGGPPRLSTAPQHSAAPVVPDTPVPWPLPTKTQQKLSTTSSVALQNQAVQDRSAGGAAQMGEPMAPHELSHVKGVLSMLLDASAQDNTPANAKKREDIAKRLEELYSMLQNGQVRAAAAQKLLQLVKAVEAQDFPTANKIQMELCKMDWDTNRNWLMGVKRLIPQR